MFVPLQHAIIRSHPLVQTLMYLNFAFGTSSDLMVAIALCYWLYVSRTGIPRFVYPTPSWPSCDDDDDGRTNSLIKTLMLYTVNTGMIVALVVPFVLFSRTDCA